MSYDHSQAAVRRHPVDKNRRIDPTLGISRGDPASQKEYVSPFETGRFAMIGRLESGVSKIQTATIGVEKIKGMLSEMKRFLEEEGYRSFRAQIPVSGLQVLPERENTYAEPVLFVMPRIQAPIRACSPERATEPPKYE